MVDKQSFFDGISESIDFDESFYKKIYGYSFYDKDFLYKIAKRLVALNRKDIIEEYNSWLMQWQEKYQTKMKAVSKWYANECSKKYKESNANQVEAVSEIWNQKQVQLLLEKKRILLMKKLEILTSN